MIKKVLFIILVIIALVASGTVNIQQVQEDDSSEGTTAVTYDETFTHKPHMGNMTMTTDDDHGDDHDDEESILGS